MRAWAASISRLAAPMRRSKITARRSISRARCISSTPSGSTGHTRLSSSLKHTAEAHEALAQFAAAETDYRASLSITRDLVGKQPANADLKADLQQIETALGELGVTRSLCVAASNQ